MAAPRTHVVLVGMMGAGKTSVAKRVARRLGWHHVDSDRRIELRQGRTIPQIFAADGEAGFRRLESEILAGVLKAPGPLVVSTGGGAVLDPANRALLRERATVVWLRASPETLASRVRGGKGRPLLADDPLGALRRIDAERREAYLDAAHVVVDVDGLTADEVADAVVAVVHGAAAAEVAP